MAHVHRWQRTKRLECSCGADGQACEGCGVIRDITKMRSDGDGCWLCDACYEEMQRAAEASGKDGGR